MPFQDWNDPLPITRGDVEDDNCAIAVTPNGQQLITASFRKGIICVWNLETGERLHTMCCHEPQWGHKSLGVTRDGQKVVSVGDREIRVWSLLSRRY